MAVVLAAATAGMVAATHWNRNQVRQRTAERELLAKTGAISDGTVAGDWKRFVRVNIGNDENITFFPRRREIRGNLPSSGVQEQEISARLGNIRDSEALKPIKRTTLPVSWSREEPALSSVNGRVQRLQALYSNMDSIGDDAPMWKFRLPRDSDRE